jgi:acyl transferase domain-containing protein/acyl carrier protein
MSQDKGNRAGIDRTGNEIAVIGMSGRFPGAETCEKLWENLTNGVESVTFFSERELAEAGVEERFLQDPFYVKGRAVLDGIEYFDASFFGYIPAEAEVMDPQVRIFHQCVWEALEDSGQDPGSYPGFIGLYAGASSNFNWQALVLLKGAGGKLAQFSVAQLKDKDFMTTHISYKLNLKGPSFTLSTACSTSLAAVVLACQGLLIGECDMALAGGVTIAVPRAQGYTYREGLVSSPDGHCRAFDAKAEGTVSGNGAGVVVLKMLDEAVAEGDQVYALIKGAALNNDGIRKAGYTAPSIDGQAEAINAALEMAEVDPESIGYIETHGTGTPLGDPVEIEALKSAFHTGKKRYCAIGSIKTNMGHLDSAAGIAGFIKTVLALKHRLIPPGLHFETPNPQVDFENSAFYVNTTLTQWQPQYDGDGNAYPLRAGVSSFGIGGTNAHVVLEEAPVIGHQSSVIGETGREPGYQLILLSARTETALEKMTGNLTEFFKKNLLNPGNHDNPTNPGLTLADAAYTLKLGRKAFNHRQTVVAATVEATIAALLSPGSAQVQRFCLKEGGQDPHLIFMFPGLGSQYVNMGRELYQTESVFRREMDRCFEILKPLLGYDLKEILYPGDLVNSSLERGGPEGWGASNLAASPNKIHQIEIAQIVIFIFEYSLAVLLMKWGMKPHAMIGYSVGEYAAACLSGVFSLQDALRLIAARGKLLKKTAAGVLLSVPLPREELNPIINNHLSLAIDNGPSSIIAGTTAAVEAFENQMKKKKIICMRLPGQDTHAPHSKLMDPILQEFQEVVASIKRNEPQIPYISNVTGNWITAAEAMSSTYWANHLRETVRFAHGMKELIKDKTAIFMEVGPGRDLSILATRYLHNDSSQQVVSLMPHSRQKTAEYYFLLKRVGQLWLYGAPTDWKAFHEREKEKRYRISLPTYPFERQCYPVEGNPFRIARDLLSAGLPPGRKADIKDWFYVPLWQQFPLPDIDPADPPGHWYWLIFIDDNGLGERMVKVLKKIGQHVVIVKKGPRFSRVSDEEFTLCISRPGDYDSLFIELRQGKQVPRKLLHLWNVTKKDSKGPSLEKIDRDLDLGLFSLLYIARAVGRQSITSGIDIHVVSDHMQKVTGEEVLCPQKAAVLGPVKIIPLEYTNITCHSIDIVCPEPGSQEENQLVNGLLAGFLSADSPLVAAYRGVHLWVPVVKPYPIQQSKEKAITRLRQNGVYLVTGGLGGMGLTLAQYLAQQVNARLVLIGRSRFPDRDQWDRWLSTHDNDDKISVKIMKVRDMETSGAEVMICSADAANLQQMKKAIDRAQERFGPINGVLHTAGLADYEGVIQRRTREMTESILAPKIKGTLVLDRLLKDTPLDFFILFSSLGNILYKVKFGQVGYNAANEFLDAYALYNTTANKRFTMTINWTDWLEVGMAVEAVEKAHRKGNPGASVHHEYAIYPHEGIEVFCRVLGTRMNNIVISIQELDNVIKQIDKVYENNMHDARPHIHVSPLQQEDRPASGKLRPRPHLDVTYLAPTNETHLELVRIWQDFFGIQRIGINDDFFDLGGDSLKAMTIANIIHKQMGANIPLAEFFSSPTIKKLSQFISVSREEEYLSIRAAETREYYGLSSAQKRLYFLQQMEEGSTVYNEPLVVVLEGGLDRQKLERTFRRLIRRWENFRTSFRVVNEEPIQEIQGEVEFEIEELAAPPDKINHEEGKGLEEKKIIKNFIRPFNLSRAPLFRVGLIKKEERKHILIVDTHHIVTDGVSNGIFISEMIGVYAGKGLPLPALQYKDYARWLNQPRQQAALEKQADYWLRQFQGDIHLLTLPTDYVRPEVQSFAGDIAAFGIGKEETRQLKALAAAEDVTLYMLLLAIFYLFLSKVSGQEDVVLGTNVAGRRHLDLQHIIGVFVNTLALRNYPSPGKPFHYFLKEVKNTTLQAFENQDYQFEELVSQVAVNRDLSRNPLFDVFFSYIDVETHMQQSQVPENLHLAIAPYPYENKTAKFDLTLNAGEKEENLSFSFEYCTKLFKNETIRRFIR